MCWPRAALIDVRQLVLEANPFGSEQIKQLRIAIAGSQVGDVRQALAELFNNVADGDASKRNHMALGITCYLMARHAQAAEQLAKVSGDGAASFYLGHALVSLGCFDESRREVRAGGARLGQRRLYVVPRGGGPPSGPAGRSRIHCSQHGPAPGPRVPSIRSKWAASWPSAVTPSERSIFERAVDMDPHQHRCPLPSGEPQQPTGERRRCPSSCTSGRCPNRRSTWEPFINLGLMYEDQEMYLPAAFCFRRALEFDPNNSRARLYLKDVEAAGDMFFDEDTVRRSRELEAVLQITIADFELSARSRNCLERAGIQTLGDLTRVTEAELLSNKNFGETLAEGSPRHHGREGTDDRSIALSWPSRRSHSVCPRGLDPRSASQAGNDRRRDEPHRASAKVPLALADLDRG